MQDRHGRFHSVVDQEKGVQVVESPYCDYVRSKAVKAFQDLLQAHPILMSILSMRIMMIWL